MATNPQTATITLDDFLATVALSEERSEFVDGRVVSLGAASFAHNLIVSNVLGTLFADLRGTPCRAVSQGMLVKPTGGENAFLPDVAVFCGEPELEPRTLELLLNPVVLIEVLSPSTADYDHGQKWESYRGIPALREYLLIAQDQPRVEQYTRHGEHFWHYKETLGREGEVRLESLNVSLTLSGIYEGVLAADERSA
jgi:Uma2 family endonuclease